MVSADNWQNITKDCSAQISINEDQALVYLLYNGYRLGYFDLDGFHYMEHIKKNKSFRISLGSKINNSSFWFEVSKRRLL